MMTPHLAPDLLGDYLRGELAPAEDALALAHLYACPACRLDLERETALTDYLRAAAAQETFELPAEVKAAVRQKLRVARSGPFPSLLAALRPAFALPIAAAILIGTLTFPSVMRTIQPARPTIDAAFYLNAHAAQQAAEPLSEHNPMPTSVQTAYTERIDANDVAR
jgi:anti-sigma factor RsiW